MECDRLYLKQGFKCDRFTLTEILKCDLLNSQALALKLFNNQAIGFVLTYGGIVHETLGKSRCDRKRTF
jgi:hypothetical protein